MNDLQVSREAAEGAKASPDVTKPAA